MKILLDSSAIIEYMRRDEHVSKLLEESEDINISAISMYEVLVGTKEHERKGIARFLKDFPLIPFTARDSLRATQISKSLVDSGKTINVIDILLAGQAMERGLTMITKDRDFENVKGLAVQLLKQN